MPIRQFGPNRMLAFQPRNVSRGSENLVSRRPTVGLGPTGMPGSADYDPSKGAGNNIYERMGLFWNGSGVSRTTPLDVLSHSMTADDRNYGLNAKRTDAGIDQGKRRIDLAGRGLDQSLQAHRDEVALRDKGLNQAADIANVGAEQAGRRMDLTKTLADDKNALTRQSMLLNAATQFDPGSVKAATAPGGDVSLLQPRTNMDPKLAATQLAIEKQKPIALKQLENEFWKLHEARGKKKADGFKNPGWKFGVDAGIFDGPDTGARQKLLGIMQANGLTPDDITNPTMRKALGFGDAADSYTAQANQVFAGEDAETRAEAAQLLQQGMTVEQLKAHLAGK